MQTFLGLLAHEIHSRIAGIQTTSAALLKGVREDMLALHYSLIHANSHYVLQVLDNMVDTAKFSRGKLQLQPVYSRFHFRDWLHRLHHPLESSAAAKEVQIQVHLDDVPEYLVTDPVKLGQVLRNLPNNAVKIAIPDTNIDLHVYSDDERRICFEVTGQEIGIALEKAHQLFQPFRQLEKGIAGKGMGLYISKLCITVLGGEIEVNSDNDVTPSLSPLCLEKAINNPANITFYICGPKEVKENLPLAKKKIASFLKLEIDRMLDLYQETRESNLLDDAKLFCHSCMLWIPGHFEWTVRTLRYTEKGFRVSEREHLS